jgi:hypothetical protein
MRIVPQRGLPSSGVAHPLLHPGRWLAPASERSKAEVAEEEQGGQARSPVLCRAPEVLCAKPRPVRHPGVDGLADAEPARMAGWSGGLLLIHLAAIACH